MITIDIKKICEEYNKQFIKKINHCFIDDVYYKYSNNKDNGMTKERYLFYSRS